MRSSGKPSKGSSCAKALRKKAGSATLVVVWQFADTRGVSTKGTTQFKVTRA